MELPDRIDQRSQDEFFMRQALLLAEQGAAMGEVPVGAVLVYQGEIVGRGFNQPIMTHDPSAHAEMQAIRQAAVNINNYRLPNTTLYVTLEPCSMCAGLLVHARIARLVYATTEPRAGAIESRTQFLENRYLNHHVQVEGGLMAEESARLLRDFFRARRKHNVSRDLIDSRQ
ncbi:tRNA adenosine(34) deaminase TadA [Thiopseudomonas acetoxidans]|uniref:tRNA-specific adenosine deaminase n=1 Tax=Thiopseudomonas acetoxidans TaxID=3041622 RepID=A0ABT7SLZ9_9GAMM|nr:tRNA adenosine(34) deaminase TadA [Thiopseudomonas sp. CY1220]MDM7857218.1 tRNA adenosine(34) deaminase TadA [Thiopseudomonas sp. CY1220]NLC09760.1 tRNA adenosine(34) deaminase TadA [Gammaproteobacteria bacterium]